MVSRKQIEQAMNTWLIGFLPDSMDHAVDAISWKLGELITRFTHYEDPRITVWRKYDSPSVLRFEYLCLDGTTPMLGWYEVDLKFWDRRDTHAEWRKDE